MNHTRINRISGAFLLLCALAANANDLSGVVLNLKLKYPKTNFSNIKASPVPGIYEVTMGKNVAYVEESGRYFFFGSLYDMQDQVDLSVNSRKAANKVDFASLNQSDSIQVVYGTGETKLAVFTDPDCPYCKKLQADLSKLENVTISYFLYPLESLHPEALKKSISVWCSENPSKAWNDFMLDEVKPVVRDCDNPIKRNIETGNRLGFSGTPVLVSEDGRVLEGARPLAQIKAWLKGDK